VAARIEIGDSVAGTAQPEDELLQGNLLSREIQTKTTTATHSVIIPELSVVGDGNICTYVAIACWADPEHESNCGRHR